VGNCWWGFGVINSMMKQTTKTKDYNRDINGTPINRSKIWGKKNKCPKQDRRESKFQLEREM